MSADRQRLLNSLVREGIALAIGEDHCRGGRADQLDGRNGQAEDRAQVQLELVGELRHQRHHPRVMRARAELGEDRLLAPDEEFDAEDAAENRAASARTAGCQLSR